MAFSRLRSRHLRSEPACLAGARLPPSASCMPPPRTRSAGPAPIHSSSAAISTCGRRPRPLAFTALSAEYGFSEPGERDSIDHLLARGLQPVEPPAGWAAAAPRGTRPDGGAGRPRADGPPLRPRAGRSGIRAPGRLVDASTSATPRRPDPQLRGPIAANRHTGRRKVSRFVLRRAQSNGGRPDGRDQEDDEALDGEQEEQRREEASRQEAGCEEAGRELGPRRRSCRQVGRSFPRGARAQLPRGRRRRGQARADDARRCERARQQARHQGPQADPGPDEGGREGDRPGPQGGRGSRDQGPQAGRVADDQGPQAGPHGASTRRPKP